MGARGLGVDLDRHASGRRFQIVARGDVRYRAADLAARARPRPPFYDHDFLESVHHTKPRLARDAIAQLSFAESFIALLPDAFATQLIDTVVVMYGADFSQRPTDVARKRMRFAGAYRYTESGDL